MPWVYVADPDNFDDEISPGLTGQEWLEALGELPKTELEGEQAAERMVAELVRCGLNWEQMAEDRRPYREMLALLLEVYERKLPGVLERNEDQR